MFQQPVKNVTVILATLDLTILSKIRVVVYESAFVTYKSTLTCLSAIQHLLAYN